MKRKNFFVAKLVAVTLMLGFFSPSIHIQDVAAPEKVASLTELELSQGLLSKLATSDIKITLFTQAEARKKKRYRKTRRKVRRKARRRANYRHHRRLHHRDRYYRDQRSNTGAVIGAAVVGAVVGAAVNEASQD